MNKVILSGYIASDIDLKQTTSGVAVATIQLAVKRPHTKDQTDFFTCNFWRGTAEFLANYFKKGSGIEIVGTLTTRTWDDQNGNKRYAVEVNVDEAEFGKKSKDDSGADTSVKKSDLPKFEELSNEDDLPF